MNTWTYVKVIGGPWPDDSVIHSIVYRMGYIEFTGRGRVFTTHLDTGVPYPNWVVAISQRR